MRPVRLKHPFLGVVVLSLLLSPYWSVSQTQTSPQPTANSAKATAQAKVHCTNNGTYVNSKGQTVPRPENCSGAPRGATAQCRDGTYSFSQSRRGTCSHHGGVARWL